MPCGGCAVKRCRFRSAGFGGVTISFDGSPKVESVGFKTNVLK